MSAALRSNSFQSRFLFPNRCAIAKFSNAFLLSRSFSSEKQNDKIFITTPIFYVNAAPHIGHVYSSALADFLARFSKLQGKSVKLSTGTDEHGLKVQKASSVAKVDPYLFCSQNSAKFKDLFDMANIGYTDYIRTTQDNHKKSVVKLWNILAEKGYIYKGEHSGWYSITDEAFYTDDQVVHETDTDNGTTQTKSLETGSAVEWTNEVNYKFKLSAFNAKLLELIESDKISVSPEIRKNEVLAWLRNGVPDISVSRPQSRLSWGIPVPGDATQTIYVWIDALINYLAVDGFYNSDYSPSGFFPPDYQVVGKDILKFHSIYWPALLIAADLPLPKRIIAHGHWTMENLKMSKSRGNVVDPVQVMNEYSVDGFRYFLARIGSIMSDNNYSELEVHKRYNTELADHFGNLASRCLSSKLNFNFVAFGNISAEIAGSSDVATLANVDSRDKAIHQNLTQLPDKIADLYTDAKFSAAIIAINETLGLANKYFSDNAPWAVAKFANPSDPKDRMTRIGYYACESIRISAILLSPIIPTKAAQILDAFHIPKDQRSWQYTALGSAWGEFLNNDGRIKRDIPPIFPRRIIK